MSAKLEFRGPVSCDPESGHGGGFNEAKWVNPNNPTDTTIHVPHFATGLITVSSEDGESLVLSVRDNGYTSKVTLAKAAKADRENGGYSLRDPGMQVTSGNEKKVFKLANGGVVTFTHTRPNFRGVGMRRIPLRQQGEFVPAARKIA